MSNKMRPEVKKKWVAALRSGKYEQSTGALRKEDGYCCLGVLCDLHRKTIKKKDCKWDLIDYSYFGHDSLLPTEVIAWARLDSEDPTVTRDGEAEPLSELNDANVEFNEIATLINKWL